MKNTTDSPGYASFYGSRNTSTSYRPKLAVTYTDTPATAESASVSPRYVKDSTNATLTYTGLPASALARVEYKIIEYDESTSTAGDTVVDFSENTAVSSGDKLPYLEEGCYRVYVRGVNSAGTAGNAKSAGLVRVDRTKPEVGSVTFEDSSGNAITDEFTEETNPVINFSGADDTYLETSGIKYALVPKGTTEAGADFKAAASLTVNDTKPYSGSFRFTAEDQAAESGSYTLSVKFEDRAGNAVVKKFTYNKDNEDPAGSGSYVTVQPDTTYYVSDITDSAAYTRVFTVKATAQSGKNLNDSSLTIYADTMQPEVFCIEVHSVKNVQEERLI